jgi:pyruvate kinase
MTYKQHSKTKIVATVGPASSSPKVLEDLIIAGVDVFRLNFSHGNYDEMKAIVESIYEISDRLEIPIAVLADLQGPKIRIGEVENNEVILEPGKILTFTTLEMVGNSERVFIKYDNFPKDVKVGERVLIDDGKLVLEVTETNKINEVKARVIIGGKLSSKKGVNLPNTKISIPCLTPKDLKDLEFALSINVNWIGLSFVRSANDVIELRHIISNHNRRTRIIAKIETPMAVEDIDDILREADGIMVARGDLGVEMPIYEIPLIQKMIVKKCINASKPVIIATQMMESMITNLTPLRAEINDVANSVLDGADALMLSGETSVGQHPVKVIEAMHSIIQRVEESRMAVNYDHPPTEKNERYISDAICHSACLLAKQTGASAIITMTHSGYTAFKLSSYRPNANIFIFTDNKGILRMLNLLWGVRCFYYDKNISTDHTIADIKMILKKKGFIKEGDYIINIASIPLHEKGRSNMLKLSAV